MAEYIDKEAFLKYVKENAPYTYVNHIVEIMVNAFPTADVVEVVRCKDCKHYRWVQEPYHGRTKRYCKLRVGLVEINSETFCSYGEMKNDNG